MEIVTGSTGAVHVTPIDDAVRNSNVGYVNDRVVFTYLENLKARAITANEVRVFSGYGMNQGRVFKIDRNDYDSVTIENGSQGNKRADLIVARYTMDSQTGFEDISLAVIKGQSGASYTDPSYTIGNINEGDELDDFPLYRVKINGLIIESVEQLFTLLPDGGRLGQLEKKIDTDIKVNLENENSGNLDDCENEDSLDIGVKGNLPITHGGTGQPTAQAGFNALASGATANTTTPTDNDIVITKTGTTWYQKTFAKIWDYIKDKISTVLGLTVSNYGGTAATATTLASTLEVSKGGTGKTSIANGAVLVGNGTSTPTEKAVVPSLENPSNDKIPTAKAVSDALGSAGYGDMLKSTYDPDNNGIIGIEQGGTGVNTTAGIRNILGLGNTTDALPVANGGTGTTDGTLNGVKLGVSGTTRGYYDAGGTFRSFRQPTGNAAVGDVLSGKTFANASSDALTGSMPNIGAVSQTINPGGSYTIPAGYHNGSGKVTANPNQNYDTFTPTGRVSKLDMGANNTYRYLNTTNVSNSNSETYTFPSGDTGGTKDLGATNTYRYANATNVYNKGKADGVSEGHNDFHDYYLGLYGYVDFDAGSITLNISIGGVAMQVSGTANKSTKYISVAGAHAWRISYNNNYVSV